MVLAGSNRKAGGRKVTLVESTNLIFLERTDYAMQDASVVEENKIFLAPIVRVDQAGCDGGSLHLVQNVTNLLQIFDVCTVGVKCAVALGSTRKRVDDEFSSAARMNLEVETSGDRVLPENRKRLGPRLFPSRKLGVRQFQAFRFNAQASRKSMRRRHPHVRVRSVSDLRPHSQTLQVRGKDVKHRLARDEGGSAKRNSEFITSSVVVSTRLRGSSWNGDTVQSSDLGRCEFVERGVDVPPVETRDSVGCILFRDAGLVEGDVVGMLELGFGEAFVVVHGAISDKLDLRLARDGLEVGMEDRLFGTLRFIVPVSVGLSWITVWSFSNLF